MPVETRLLWLGDIPEALRQADIVRAICGPVPPSPSALRLIERFNQLAAEKATRERVA